MAGLEIANKVSKMIEIGSNSHFWVRRVGHWHDANLVTFSIPRRYAAGEKGYFIKYSNLSRD